MTFSLSLEEWLEGQRLYARAQNRFAPIFAVICAVLALLIAVPAVSQHDARGGVVLLFLLWPVAEEVWLWRWRAVRLWRRIGRGEPHPWAYDFREQGFYFRCLAGDFSARWDAIPRRLEGRSVWVMVSTDKKYRVFIIPKRATLTAEGARAWAVVDAHFSPPSVAPIAEP